MTMQSAGLPSFSSWFRDNPGHVARALPAFFVGFSAVLAGSFLLPQIGMSDAFFMASLVGCAAGAGRTVVCYLQAVASARRPEAEPVGAIIWLKIMAGLAITSVVMLMLIPVLSRIMMADQ